MATTEAKTYTNLSNAKRAAAKALALFKLPADQPVDFRDAEHGKIMPVILRRPGEDAQPFIGLAGHGFRVEDQPAQELGQEPQEAAAQAPEEAPEELDPADEPLVVKKTCLDALEAVAPPPEPPARKPKADTANADGLRAGSKKALILDLAKRPEGVTSAELIAATGWKRPDASVRTAAAQAGYAVTVTREQGADGKSIVRYRAEKGEAATA